MNLNLFRKKVEEIVALKSLTYNNNFDKAKEYAVNFLVDEKFSKLGYTDKQRQLIFAVRLKDFEDALKDAMLKKGYDVKIEIDDYFPIEMNVSLTLFSLNAKRAQSYEYDISYNESVFSETLSKYDFVLPLDSLTAGEHPDWVRLVMDFPEVKKVMWKLIETKIKQSKQTRISLLEKRIKENESKKNLLNDAEYIKGEISHLAKENKLLQEEKSRISNQIKKCDIDEISKI